MLCKASTLKKAARKLLASISSPGRTMQSKQLRSPSRATAFLSSSKARLKPPWICSGVHGHPFAARARPDKRDTCGLLICSKAATGGVHITMENPESGCSAALLMKICNKVSCINPIRPSKPSITSKIERVECRKSAAATDPSVSASPVVQLFVSSCPNALFISRSTPDPMVDVIAKRFCSTPFRISMTLWTAGPADGFQSSWMTRLKNRSTLPKAKRYGGLAPGSHALSKESRSNQRQACSAAMARFSRREGLSTQTLSWALSPTVLDICSNMQNAVAHASNCPSDALSLRGARSFCTTR
mmetsp:Transcript_5859/g.36328  ORF Transcript_5859/g.36328 Transcript_5859/m.36328 type:complete len:301 (+) Transcript_5859:1484-2386(+)